MAAHNLIRETHHLPPSMDICERESEYPSSTVDIDLPEPTYAPFVEKDVVDTHSIPDWYFLCMILRYELLDLGESVEKVGVFSKNKLICFRLHGTSYRACSREKSRRNDT
ncbi:hypothetical protein SDJN02_24415, partial [Cucurbita argyrosperma subsp. argyrosperma]